MLEQRQEFNVSKTQVDDIVGEWFRDLAVGQRTIVLFDNVPPRSEMQPVNRDGSVRRVALFSFREPRRIAPGIRQVGDDRGVMRSDLTGKTKRIGLVGSVEVVL